MSQKPFVFQYMYTYDFAFSFYMYIFHTDAVNASSVKGSQSGAYVAQWVSWNRISHSHNQHAESVSCQLNANFRQLPRFYGQVLLIVRSIANWFWSPAIPASPLLTSPARNFSLPAERRVASPRINSASFILKTNSTLIYIYNALTLCKYLGTDGDAPTRRARSAQCCRIGRLILLPRGIARKLWRICWKCTLHFLPIFSEFRIRNLRS